MNGHKRFWTGVGTMNWKDQRVVRAMGPNFEDFRRLALRAFENPAERQTVEREMTAILERLTPQERVELRAALMAARRR